MSFSKECAKCGAAFECKADDRGCWCEQFTVSTDNLQLLQRQYADCLCPGCLKAYAEYEPTSSGT